MLLSQYTTATLSGIVTDARGLTVPGARLTVENTGTGLVHTCTTAEDGAYLLPALPVGTYRLTAQRVVDLPLNGRQAQSLLFLAPGTINTTLYYCGSGCPNGATSVAAVPEISIIKWMAGVTTDRYINSNNPFPNPDALQEFSVQTNNLSAEYGNSAVTVNIVTKFGTNFFHGALFEFVRNGNLNARNFFAQTSDTQKRNQFGAAGGGRIVRNKLFFFGTWQRTTLRTATPTSIAFVPTAQERSGDFSDLSTLIRDPDTDQPFPGNRIPAGQVSFLGPSRTRPTSSSCRRWISPAAGTI